ncbi:MAG: neutral/alkaline non-lysosomal ceramidase N-terminal domain-containing protein [Halioglobus sp.]|nr:neutral/alkaline non-lysosomal ceramidase N-terminal domain-containing protein [Halioglobus sp.]
MGLWPPGPEGLHVRLRSRAFIIAEARTSARRLVLVSVDLGSIDHHIVLGVLENLQAHFSDAFTLGNVIIGAMHTHAGPTGYWQTRTDTGFDGGHYPEHYAAVVQGITDSIFQAHHDLEPGAVSVNTGRVENTGVNRSAIAYLENPAAERDRYADNTNTTMTLLKFTRATGDIGLINWYGLHLTAMNDYNRLVSGDYKGDASLQEERSRGVTYNGSE